MLLFNFVKHHITKNVHTYVQVGDDKSETLFKYTL